MISKNFYIKTCENACFDDMNKNLPYAICKMPICNALFLLKKHYLILKKKNIVFFLFFFLCSRLIFVNYQSRYFIYFNILFKKAFSQGSNNNVFVNCTCGWKQPLEVFFMKRCSKIFRKIHRKYLWQSLFLIKVADLSLQLYLKKRLCHRCFPADFAKFLRTTFLQYTTARQLLYGPCIIFSTQGANDGFLIDRYLARLMVFPQYSSFKQGKTSTINSIC